MKETLSIAIQPHSRFGYLFLHVFAVYNREAGVNSITETARGIVLLLHNIYRRWLNWVCSH